MTLISTPYNLMKIIQMVYRAIPIESIMLPAQDMVQFSRDEFLEDVEREMLKPVIPAIRWYPRDGSQDPWPGTIC